MTSLIIPANNEEKYLGACLDTLIASEPCGEVEIIVAANGCVDRTVEVAESRRAAIEGRGWRLVVLDLPEGGKARALNAADDVAHPGIRVYIDADVLVEPALIPQLVAELSSPGALYASGRMTVRTPQTRISRLYGRVWTRLPFMQDGVQGCGVYALSPSGRSRWDRFPEIISDDSFVRLQFRPTERRGVPAAYSWPLPEGVRNLVRVRRRADAGMDEIRALYPHLPANEGKPKPGFDALTRLMAELPLSLGVYVAIVLLSRLTPWRRRGWSRGR